MRRLVGVALAVSVAAAGAGCSDDQQVARSFGARPFDIPVQRIVDPCAALTPAQQKDLVLEEPARTRPTVNGEPSIGCVWVGRIGDSDLGYGFQVIPLGAEVALTDPATTIVQINGFGAAQNTVQELTGGAPTCQVTIDAEPGQSIRVQAQSQETRPRIRSDEEMCRRTTDVASMMLTNVVATTR